MRTITDCGEFYDLKETVVVSRIDGIMGPYSDFDIDDTDTDILIDLHLRLPKSLWKPVVLKVEVPAEYKRGQAVGSVDEINVPIDIEAELNKDEKVSYFSIAEITDGEPTGIIGVIKKKVDDMLYFMRSDEEKMEVVNRHKEIRIKRLKEELKQLEGE